MHQYTLLDNVNHVWCQGSTSTTLPCFVSYSHCWFSKCSPYRGWFIIFTYLISFKSWDLCFDAMPEVSLTVVFKEFLWVSDFHFLFPCFLYRVYPNLKEYKSLHFIFDDISIFSIVYILWVYVHFYNQLLYPAENFPEYEKHRIVH